MVSPAECQYLNRTQRVGDCQEGGTLGLIRLGPVYLGVRVFLGLSPSGGLPAHLDRRRFLGQLEGAVAVGLLTIRLKEELAMVTRFLERPDSSRRHTRADVDLEHRLVNFLHERHVPEWGELDVEAHGGVVVIGGQLPSQHAKWLCIGCCRHVAGVIKLIDEIKVPEKPEATGAESEAHQPPRLGPTPPRRAAQTGRGTYVRVEPGAPRIVRHRRDTFRKTRDPTSSVALVITTTCDD